MSTELTFNFVIKIHKQLGLVGLKIKFGEISSNKLASDGSEAMLVIITGECGHDRVKQSRNCYLRNIVHYVPIPRNPITVGLFKYPSACVKR